jgi:hypothetical protein
LVAKKGISAHRFDHTNHRAKGKKSRSASATTSTIINNNNKK